MFKKILAILTAYHHNFRILHWKVKDVNFEEYHELAGDYYDELQNHLDQLTEISITYNENPLGLVEAIEILKDAEGNFKILEPSEDYSSKDIQENIEIMFKDIMKCLKELLDEDKIEDNPGVKSEIETLYAWYDKECNYKNKRRK